MKTTCSPRLGLALGLLWAFGLAISAGVSTSATAAEEKEKKDLVLPGDAKCTRCHDENDDFPVVNIGKTKHGAVANSSNPQGITCTACHGESDAHVNGGGKDRPKPDRVFGKAGEHVTPASVREAACLACHGSDRNLAFWESGRHKKNDVACDNCHSIHDQPKSVLRQNNPSITPLVTTSKQLQYETCTQCHKEVRSQLMKTSHHPIIEGKLKCTSCHNPHGALSHAMVKNESVNQLCTTCHADKRGPYMYEHPPVEENCLTCHNSHGSNHPKLLADRVPNLCQDCHDASRHPGTYYSANSGFNVQPPVTLPNTRLVARACLNCHNQIHGTNGPGARGQFFLR